MKEHLKAIYEALSLGLLSREEAFAKIKAVAGRGEEGLLVARAVWEERALEVVVREGMSYAQRRVVLSGLGQVQVGRVRELVAGSECVEVSARGALAARYEAAAVACFEQVQAALKAPGAGGILLQVVLGEDEESVVLAGVSGLLKTASLENPRVVGQVIVSAASSTSEELARRLQEESVGGAALVRYVGAVRQVGGWERVWESGAAPIAFKARGVYLITGGLGGLGELFTREILAQSPSARVIVTGRGELGGERAGRLAELAQCGEVSYRRLLLEDAGEVRAVLEGVVREYGELNGILHSAGMIADEFVVKKTVGEFRRVLGPKVRGTVSLDEGSAGIDLDFLVLFSSIAAVLGNVGQADYAAGNGFMDQYARYRNARVSRQGRGGRTVSINWPLWESGGMRVAGESEELMRQRTGMRAMRTAVGMQGFYRSLAQQHSQSVVMEGEVERMYAALGASEQLAVEGAVRAAVSAVRVLEGAEEQTLTERTEEYLRREFAQLLKLPAHKIDAQAPLEQYGIDSILAMSLTHQVEKSFGPLSKTLFFEYQTLKELGQYFMRAHAEQLRVLFAAPRVGEVKAAASVERAPARAQRASRWTRAARAPAAQRAAMPAEPIAIIGLSGRYPQSLDVAAYWENLRAGRDCIVEVPKERWDWQQYFSADRSQSGQHYSKWGGFIAGVDEFDPLFFNISPREASYIDPQERLFLQHAWMAVEDAGYTRASLQIPHERDLAGQVGVYVGVMYGEYKLSGSLASVANRVSYTLNLHGPSMTLDTMCSSSLTAIHLACQDLRQGRTSLAIAGGVNVSIHPNKYLMLSAGQFISSAGQCQSFGEGGDGYIPGEGVGAVLLKRLSEAQRDGDQIYGLIRGSALNHGGRTNGYTVPNLQAQAGAIRQALIESNTDARHVSYIEAHGTGTKLGDPIEIAALAKVFQERSEERGFCLIGSAKSNIGHCESAAGIAGLTKVLLQMKHGQIVPSLHSSRLNPHIDFAQSPFIVNQTLTAWEAPRIEGRVLPRVAGISSFGAGGSNAHMIVEEYVAPSGESRGASVGRVIVPLSARTGEQLQQKVLELLEYLRGAGAGVELGALAYTLQVGREGMEERLGFLVSSLEQLLEKLAAYAQGERQIDDSYQGQVKRNREEISIINQDDDMKEAVDRWMARKKLSKLVEFWVKGLELDWGALYPQGCPRRISLPTYPFARERYWIEPAARAATAGARAAVLHPLLHWNASNLNQHYYRSILTGTEFFLASFYPDGPDALEEKVLPAAAYLEMTRAALEHAVPDRPHSSVIELRDIVWAQPLIVTANTQISIELSPSSDGEIDYEIFSDARGAETVHCQGRAVFSARPAELALDIEPLKRQMGVREYDSALRGVTGLDVGDQQVLARISVPGTLESTLGEYGLHPSVLDSALQAGVGLLGEWERAGEQPSLPFALESIKILGGCTQRMLAWVRYAADSQARVQKLDIDLCDEQGTLCAQLRGLTAGPARVAEPAGEVVEAGARGRRVALLSEATAESGAVRAVSARAARARPRGIALRAPESSAAVVMGGALRRVAGRVRLSALVSALGGVADASASAVRMYEYAEGVYGIEVEAAGGCNELDAGLMGQLLQALETLAAQGTAKVLMIAGTGRSFLTGGRGAVNAAIEARLYAVVAQLSCPVIAVLEGDAHGAGWLFAAVCDFMVCALEAQYGYTQVQSGLYASAGEEALFSERFGEARSRAFLYGGGEASGVQLKARGWSCALVARGEVRGYARELAGRLASKPRKALGLLKRHLGRRLLACVAGLEVQAPVAVEMGGARVAVTAGAGLEVHEARARVLQVTLARGVAAEELCAQVRALWSSVRAGGYYQSVVLQGEGGEFLAQLAGEGEERAWEALLLEAPVPVVAALEGDARGSSFVLGQLCAGCVYSAAGSYGVGPGAAAWAERVARWCAPGFGEFGTELVLTGEEYRGAELRARVAGLEVVEAGAVLGRALDLAGYWASFARGPLLEWQRRRSAQLQGRVLAGVLETVPSAAAPVGALELRSRVISAEVQADGVVLIRMQDREAKNMFSPAYVAGMREVFAQLSAGDGYKVVVLSGYGSYFSSGGTKESLLAIQAGRVKFTDLKIYQLALECPVPVIAAMQGHGIGAGWSLGMFADVVLFSAESRYVSPYMSYGFTPGAGATLIGPRRLGYDLGRETLLSGEPMSGAQLAARGLEQAVCAGGQVLEEALRVARAMARHGRERLVRVKRQGSVALARELEETYRRELEMHEQTFVGDAQTLARIEARFMSASAPLSAVVSAVPSTPVSKAPSAVVSAVSAELPAIRARLKELLAQELHLRAADIDEHSQFVELGMDSISGVTWVRKINAAYRLTLEATTIYSHPTLQALSLHLARELEQRAPAAVASAVVSTPVSKAPSDAVVSAVSAELPAIRARLKELLAQELHLRAADIDEHSQFVELGMDSISGVTWVRKINAAYRLTLEATTIYSHPTLQALSLHLARELEQRAPAPPAAAPALAPPAARRALQRRGAWRHAAAAPAAAAAPVREPIAVIGMAGQFAQAPDLEAFWQNIAQGRNCVSAIPAERWAAERYYHPGEVVAGKSTSQWMGALEGYDRFDPLFFNISPTEAQSMDPQQRLFLQSCWHAVEESGYDAKRLSGSKCGVFVGCASGDYQQLSAAQRLSAQGFTGGASSILAARISYFLNLQGPCVAIDTACSSSLVAVAQACESLISGASDLALAGGVYVMASAEMHIKASQAGMLSPDGRCYSFDQRANGFVPGEGVGVVVLKRLRDAERDQDLIHGLIEGWGVNQDGKTNGITAPNPHSQTRLQRQVYDQYGIDPGSIQLIEAHGTGTKLGDPIEVQGLKESFKVYTHKQGYCALGSVKSNIGHCLTAAGISGVLKLLLALKHRKLPPSINFEQLNEHIALAGSPFYINTQLQEWAPAGAERRRAAISSFGFSGTNAHMVIGEYRGAPAVVAAPVSPISAHGESLIVLSARTPEQLREKARELGAYITRTPALDLVQLAYTLQVGREAMSERVAVMATDLEQVLQALGAYQRGESHAGLYRRPAGAHPEGMSIISRDDEMKESILDRWIGARQLAKVLEWWVSGIEVHWEKLYGAGRPQRLRVPLYPFAAERYWIEAPTPAAQRRAVLHPLLHTNTSDLEQQSYRSSFTGEESFLADHRVRTPQGIERILPGVAYLEMARAALEQALPRRAAGSVLELRRTVWLKPLVVRAATEVSLELHAESGDASPAAPLEFEVYARQAGEECLHAQGQALFSAPIAPVRLDLAQLRARMRRDTLHPDTLYGAFTHMGLLYGPAHQGVIAVQRGEDELLAEIALPPCVRGAPEQYALHPSLLDCALQACLGLLIDFNSPPAAPALPFALESLRVLGPCPEHLFAWVRRSEDGAPTHHLTKLDIDLCDHNGTLCVRLSEFSTRTFAPVTKSPSFDEDHYQRIIDRLAKKELSIEEAVEFG